MTDKKVCPRYTCSYVGFCPYSEYDDLPFETECFEGCDECPSNTGECKDCLFEGSEDCMKNSKENFTEDVSGFLDINDRSDYIDPHFFD